MSKLLKLATPLCAAIALSACASMPSPIPEQPALAELPEMDSMSYETGFRMDYVDELTGEKRNWTVTDVSEDGTVYATINNGCKWWTTKSWFDGVLGWENCGTGDWSTGEGVATKASEPLWPLADGKTATYSYSLTNSVGKTDKHTRKCAVSTANVETSIGPLDAYKVACKDGYGEGSNIRTWYISPEHGEISFSRWEIGKGMRTHNRYL